MPDWDDMLAESLVNSHCASQQAKRPQNALPTMHLKNSCLRCHAQADDCSPPMMLIWWPFKDTKPSPHITKQPIHIRMCHLMSTPLFSAFRIQHPVTVSASLIRAVWFTNTKSSPLQLFEDLVETCRGHAVSHPTAIFMIAAAWTWRSCSGTKGNWEWVSNVLNCMRMFVAQYFGPFHCKDRSATCTASPQPTTIAVNFLVLGTKTLNSSLHTLFQKNWTPWYIQNQLETPQPPWTTLEAGGMNQDICWLNDLCKISTLSNSDHKYTADREHQRRIVTWCSVHWCDLMITGKSPCNYALLTEKLQMCGISQMSRHPFPNQQLGAYSD